MDGFASRSELCVCERFLRRKKKVAVHIITYCSGEGRERGRGAVAVVVVVAALFVRVVVVVATAAAATVWNCFVHDPDAWLCVAKEAGPIHHET